jgi:hypothetical protein
MPKLTKYPTMECGGNGTANGTCGNSTAFETAAKGGPWTADGMTAIGILVASIFLAGFVLWFMKGKSSTMENLRSVYIAM